MTEVDEGEELQQPPRKKMSGAKKTLIILFVTLILLILAIAGVGLWMQHRLDSMIERIDDPFEAISSRPEIPSDVIESGEDPVNILILGSDSRISAGDPGQWEAGAQRTDAIMLLHISGDRQSAAAISIPRDTWVDIPEHGEAKINAAFSFGGPTLMIHTFEQLTDVRIDHFVVTDFESFSTMTDALGGVRIRLSSPLETPDGIIPAGDQRLNGEQALSYVRQRYGLSGGDFSRVQRQQNWMRSIMSEMFNKNVLSDMGELTKFVETVAQSVSVDEGFSIGEMRDLLISSRNLRSGDISFLTIPHGGTGWSPDGRQSIVLWDEEHARPLFEAIKHDELRAFLDTDPEGVTRLPVEPE